MDEVLIRVAQDGAVAYGKKPVETAIGLGRRRKKVPASTPSSGTGTMVPDASAERMGAKIVVSSTEFKPVRGSSTLGAWRHYRVTRPELTIIPCER